jgi:hypothetical protein
LKIKTLKDNVMKFGDKKGTIYDLENEDHAKFLIKKGSAEEVKPAPKKQAPKKTTKKKTEKEGE